MRTGDWRSLWRPTKDARRWWSSLHLISLPSPRWLQSWWVTSMCHRAMCCATPSAIRPSERRPSVSSNRGSSELLGSLGVGGFRRQRRRPSPLPPHFCDHAHSDRPRRRRRGRSGRRAHRRRRHRASERASAATHSTGNRPPSDRLATEPRPRQTDGQTGRRGTVACPSFLSNELRESREGVGRRDDDDDDTIGARSCIRDGR